MNIGELRQKQSLPLEAKIKMSLRRIEEFYNYYDGNVVVSFSGGKDSTVLLHLVRSIYPDVKAVFVDTGLEYPEIKQFIASIDNVDIIRPELSFKQVLDKYGYPVTTKSQATTIRKLTTQNLSERYRNKLLNGDERGNMGKLSDKWKPLLDAPFKISEQCCDVMKKRPVKKYAKENGVCFYTGEMANDSTSRQLQYLKTGCNAFNNNQPKSKPLGFWLEEDIWNYINTFNIPYSKVYDMGIDNTGCMFCMFGVHLEKEPNRFQMMKETHPKLHDYCINDLKVGEILDFIKVPY